VSSYKTVRGRAWMTVPLLLCAAALSAGGCTNFVAQSRNSEGVRLFQNGQYQEALQEFQEAAYVDPNNADGYYNLAATYHKLGRVRNQPEDLARAENCYRQCLDRDPNHHDCHRGLTVLLAEQGRTDEAFRLAQNWVDQQPSLADPKIELARLYEEFGDRAAAKERLIEAVAVDPSNPRQWAALGRLREDMGEYTQAATDYQHSLRLDQSQPEVAARLCALQNGAGRPAPACPGPAAVQTATGPTLAPR
jgi:tetratricopeptide (TPR) repeat protein